MGRSRRSMRVTSPPASRAAAAAMRISFLLKASVRVVPANARILGAVAMGLGSTTGQLQAPSFKLQANPTDPSPTLCGYLRLELSIDFSLQFRDSDWLAPGFLP